MLNEKYHKIGSAGQGYQRTLENEEYRQGGGWKIER
jgi:hypothetical protein